MNAAIDDFRLPAQNILVADKAGNIGYRTSGTGIQRKISGRRPQRALDGEWSGLQPSSSRPRMQYYVKETGADQPRWIATANERIWVDDLGHRWVDDLRKDRIRRELSSRDDFTRQDMEKLQLDTECRYYKLILDWIQKRAEPKDAEEKATIERWSKWNGLAADDATTFTEAIAVEGALVRVSIDRLKRHYFPEKDRDLPYESWMKSAWVITMLEDENGPAVFGFDARDLANHLLAVARARSGGGGDRSGGGKPYFEENRWGAQHPFVGRVPLIGDWFAVDAHPQPGWRGVVVRVEQPKFGASVRLVWDVSKPEQSTWSLPVGQSGHIRSPHYKDLQADWAAGRPVPVFEEAW
jgi:penicillin G amidase